LITPSSSIGKLLNVNEVAALLSVSPKTIRKYVWEKTIPYLKINGHVRFEKQRLYEWLEEKQVPTLDEIRYGKHSNSNDNRRTS
jgi:excisionase family DNA binding protein